MLRCGVLAGPLFVATFTAHEAALSGYDARRDPVSSLALAPHGWIQTGNFVVAGCLYGALAAGLGLSGVQPQNRREQVWSEPQLPGSWAPEPSPPTPSGATHRAPLMPSPPTAGHRPPCTTCSPSPLPRTASRSRGLYPSIRSHRRHRLGLVLGTHCHSHARDVTLASAAFSQAPALVANGGLYQRAAVTTGFA